MSVSRKVAKGPPRSHLFAFSVSVRAFLPIEPICGSTDRRLPLTGQHYRRTGSPRRANRPNHDWGRCAVGTQFTFLRDPDVQRIQRIVLAAPWPEPVAEAQKVLFPDLVGEPSLPRAGQSYLPALRSPAVVAFRRLSGSRLAATVSPDTPRDGFARADPLVDLPGLLHILPTSPRPLLPQPVSSGSDNSCGVARCLRGAAVP